MKNQTKEERDQIVQLQQDLYLPLQIIQQLSITVPPKLHLFFKKTTRKLEGRSPETAAEAEAQSP